MNKLISKRFLSAICGIAALSFSVNSYSADYSSATVPTKEAFESCSALKNGDNCSVTTNNQKVSGTCKADQAGKLACFYPTTSTTTNSTTSTTPTTPSN
jgi:hypothetical protein